MTKTKKRVGILISGTGSNMVALAKACQAQDYPAQVNIVISDKAEAAGIERARELGIDARAIARKDFDSKQAHEAAVLQALDEAELDIICLAGYMRLLSADFITKWQGRMINIHPSLLPLFPGLDTHQRAIDAGCRVHGCSVHFVTEGMDEGPIIGQAVVPIAPNDGPEELANRVQKMEHQLYPKCLAMLANGEVYMDANEHAQFMSDNIFDPNQRLIS